MPRIYCDPCRCRTGFPVTDGLPLAVWHHRAMDLGLRDRVALITGSTRGLGLASAKALAAEGCRVVLCGRTPETLAAAAGEVAAVAGGADRVLAVRADVTVEADVTRLVEEAATWQGRLDILVNNVGGGTGAGIETADADWQAAVDLTLFPAIRASRAAVPHMRRAGGGVIIHIASIFGREAGGRMTYNAVKAAEISLGKTMAQQLAPDGIRVLTVSPGSILFPGGSWWKRQQADPEGIARFVAQELPFGRFGTDGEVGDVVAFLASPRASWVSGTSVVVDGCQSRAF